MKKIAGNKTKFIITLLLLFAAAGVFGYSKPAIAATTIGQTLASILTWLWFYVFIVGLGHINILLVEIIVSVAAYNNFLDSQAVQIGWPLVRDVANMFFVVALLVIAIGTILGFEQYKWTRLLPRFVLLAVLINFSKGITGLLIDFSQVVMMTFVNAFRDVSVANLTEGFGLTKLVTLYSPGTLVDADFSDVFGGVILGSLMMIFTALVLIGILVIFTLRLLAFWVLIILSPLAFLMAVFASSKAKGYAQRWWEEMTRYMIVGPMLAFFLWLAFSVVSLYASSGTTIAESEFAPQGGQVQPAAYPAGASTAEIAARQGITQASSPYSLLSFVIFIGLLFVAMKEAIQSGVEGAGFAGRMFGYATSGRFLAKAGGFYLAYKGLGLAERKFYSKTGLSIFNPARIYRGIKAQWERKEKEEEMAGAVRAGAKAEEAFAEGRRFAGAARLFFGSPQDFWNIYHGTAGVKSAFKYTISRVKGVFGAGAAVKAGEAMEEVKNKRTEKEGYQDQLLQVQSGLEGYDEEKNRIESRRAQLSQQEEDFTNEKIDPTISPEWNDQALAEIELRINEARQRGEPTVVLERAFDQMKKKIDEGDVFSLTREMRGALSAETIGSYKQAAGTKIGQERESLSQEEASFQQKEAEIEGKREEEKDLKGKIDVLQREIDTITKDKLDWYKVPHAWYASANYRQMEAEKVKEIPKEPVNSGYLYGEMLQALKQKDRARFMALFKKAAEDYNDNDILNAFGYAATPEGFEAFRKEVMVGGVEKEIEVNGVKKRVKTRGLGMTKQESLARAQEVSYMAEGKKHYGVGRMYAMDPATGAYADFDEETQIKGMLTELLKADVENVLRQTNRLGFGGEEADGSYTLTRLGMMYISRVQSKFEEMTKRARWNPNFLLKIVGTEKSRKQLEEMVKKGLLKEENYKKMVEGYEALPKAAREVDLASAVRRMRPFAPPKKEEAA